MNTSRLTAGASRFAHLAGFSRASRAASDGDGDEDQAKGKKSKRADDGDGDGDEDQAKGKKSKRADEGDDDNDDQANGKRSKHAADDDAGDEDDDKEEMEGRSARASARRREQSRIASILGHKAAANNVALAVSLACETRMTRQEAIAVLKGQARDDDDDRGPSGNRHARQDRSSRNVQLGGDPPSITGHQAVTASWDSAFKKAGIATR